MPISVRKLLPYVRKASIQGTDLLSGLLTVIGFRLLFQLFGDRKKPEQAKRVLHRSRLHALAHSIVHLIPMTVLVWITYLNYKGVYYGPALSVFAKQDSMYFALYQVGAKVIEITCVMSLGIVLLHVLRHDLIYGSGAPLGLLTSPLWFAAPQCVVSPEFLTALQLNLRDWWSFLRYGRHSPQSTKASLATLWRSSRMILLVIILIVEAALIGPSTAVLLIPREQKFRAGGVTYYLNATFDEMWPSNVSSADELEVCFGTNATLYPTCPSGGYGSLRYQGGYNGIYDTGAWTPSVSVETEVWFLSRMVRDPLGILPPVLSAGTDYRGARPWTPTYVDQPNLYTASLASTLVRDWYSAIDAMFPSLEDAKLSNPHFNLKNFHWVTEDLHATGSSIHPTTNVRCTLPQNLSITAVEIGFPFIETQPLSDHEKGWSKYGNTKAVNITALNHGYASHLRTQWVPLSTQEFGPVSIGLLLELPWTSADAYRSRLAIACSIAAAWSEAPYARLTGSSHGAWVVNSHYAGGTDSQSRIIVLNASNQDLLDGKYNRHVALDRQWLDLLTPLAPDPPQTSDLWQPNTLENIFHAAGFDTLLQDLRYKTSLIRPQGACTFGTYPAEWDDLAIWNTRECGKRDRVAFIETTLATLVTDGLSRRLSYRAFDRVPNLLSWVQEGRTNFRAADYDLKLVMGDRNPGGNALEVPSNPDLISQRLEFAVSGIGYLASETTDYLSTVIVVLYLLTALCHVLWTICITPVTSTSWNSALELVLLAFNSVPSPALRGTSAAVHRWRTYKHTVKVRATGQHQDAKSALDTDTDMSEGVSGDKVNLADEDLQVCLVIGKEVEDEISKFDTNLEQASHGDALLRSENSNDDASSHSRSKSVTSVNSFAPSSADSCATPHMTVGSHAQRYFEVEIGKKYL